jgi:Flp pilus assembly CpaF family ATPase
MTTTHERLDGVAWRPDEGVLQELVAEVSLPHVGEDQSRLDAELERVEQQTGKPVDEHEQEDIAAKVLAGVFRERRREAVAQGRPVLSADDEENYARAVLHEIFGLGAIQALLEDEDVQEINAVGPHNVVVKYADGDRRPFDRPLAADDAAFVAFIKRIATWGGRRGRRFDTGWPFLDLSLRNGDRLWAVMEVTPQPNLVIRRHNLSRYYTLDLQESEGMLDAGLRRFLDAAVKARRNIIVSGGTFSGKTTHVRALANAIPWDERIVTIEDVAELHLDRPPNEDFHSQVVRMESRPVNVELAGAIELADLTRQALRSNADRVVVGEVRGPEVIPMLGAMTASNEGSLCTVHANSARAALSKLQSYASSAPERWGYETSALTLAHAVHFVVHLAPAKPGRPQKFVSSVLEVAGFDGKQLLTNELWSPRDGDGRAVPTGTPLRKESAAALADFGFDPDTLTRDGGEWTF